MASRNRVFTTLLITCTAVPALAIGSYAAWAHAGKDYFLPRNFAQVEPGVFRSGRLSSYTAEPTLRSHHVGVVVSLIDDADDPEGAKPMVDAMKDLGVRRVRLSMDGNGIGSPDRYATAIDAIVAAKREGIPVLVHCNAGAQRTGGVIAAYELIVRGLPPDQVRAEMIARGHDPRRNPKLIPWINANLPAIAADLARRGDIPAPPGAASRTVPAMLVSGTDNR